MLYNSLKKHGIENHKFEILCQCSRQELNNLEVYYIELYQCFNSKYGLNLQSGGNSKIKFSDETRAKMSKSHTGVKLSEEHRKNLAAALRRNPPNLGKKFSKERNKKMGETKKGNKFALGYNHTPEAIEKIRFSKKNISEETREKMREVGKNRKFTQETRKKLSDSLSGRVLSVEHKRKLQQIWDNRRGIQF